jgi:myo-inositol catabolism protein IolS
MKYRLLGRTGLKVSEIGFGAWAIGGPAKLGDNNIGWGPVDDTVSMDALNAAFDAGINFYDTADVYGWGHSEKLIGNVFKNKRDKILIASKVGNRVDENKQWVKDFSPEWVRTAVEASLKRLQTDYIDLYQLHSPNVDFEYTHQTFDVFEDLKKEGKIRSYGTSIGPVKHGLKLLKLDKGDFFQVVYNILNRGPEAELFENVLKKNVGIIARVPLASGFLTGKFKKGHSFVPDDHRAKKPTKEVSQIIDNVEKLRFLEKPNSRSMAQAALQFCLTSKAVSTCIPGAKDRNQALANAQTSDMGILSETEMAKINNIG